MKKMSETVVFFGSGPVAAEALRLLTQHFEVEAVITKPKPAHHKGSFPVIDYALSHNLRIETPTNGKELTGLFKTKLFKSPVGIVIDYGIIISSEVINAFKLGIVNSHFSLLPRWRGADPITFSILEGDAKTGVSLMLIEPTLDTGKLLTQKVLHIQPDDTTETLTERLIPLSDALLAEYLPRYVQGELKPHAQPHPDRVTHSRKLTKEDGRLDWHKPAAQLEREIRAFQPWPKSYTTLHGHDVIITRAEVVAEQGQPGKLAITKQSLRVFCGKDALEILTLKPYGKGEMTAQAFINGYLRTA